MGRLVGGKGKAKVIVFEVGVLMFRGSIPSNHRAGCRYNWNEQNMIYIFLSCFHDTRPAREVRCCPTNDLSTNIDRTELIPFGINSGTLAWHVVSRKISIWTQSAYLA